ncbi:MAG: hypothetical protein AB7S65_01260 [Sulfuricurvum sp.]
MIHADLLKRTVWFGLIWAKGVYAFWLFDWLEQDRKPLPPYVLEHPLMNGIYVYGVGNGANFLETQSCALNDIAVQLRSDVRSITTVRSNSDSDSSQTDQQIVVLTQRKISNYRVLDETHVGENVYVLIEYAQTKP